MKIINLEKPTKKMQKIEKLLVELGLHMMVNQVGGQRRVRGTKYVESYPTYEIISGPKTTEDDYYKRRRYSMMLDNQDEVWEVLQRIKHERQVRMR